VVDALYDTVWLDGIAPGTQDPLDPSFIYVIDPFRHGAKAWGDAHGPNVLFFDWHVEQLTPEDAFYADFNPTRLTARQAGRQN
jgi:prepilin-type processing-associated H-X9-DG protein